MVAPFWLWFLFMLHFSQESRDLTSNPHVCKDRSIIGQNKLWQGKIQRINNHGAPACCAPTLLIIRFIQLQAKFEPSETFAANNKDVLRESWAKTTIHVSLTVRWRNYKTFYSANQYNISHHPCGYGSLLGLKICLISELSEKCGYFHTSTEHHEVSDRMFSPHWSSHQLKWSTQTII